MKYNEIYKSSNNGRLFTKQIVEVPSEKELDVRKGKARKEIQDQVFDLSDSVADNAKMISLIFSVIQRIWDIIPDSQKSDAVTNEIVTQEEIDTINTVIEKFRNTQTWADIKWQTEGPEFADKLLSRQSKIGQIIKQVYKIQ